MSLLCWPCFGEQSKHALLSHTRSWGSQVILKMLLFITEKVVYFNNLFNSKRVICCLFLVKPDLRNAFFAKKC